MNTARTARPRLIDPSPGRREAPCCLLLTDAYDRSLWLQQRLAAHGLVVAIAPPEAVEPALQPRLLVSDVDLLAPAAVAWLRAIAQPRAEAGLPLLCLLREGSHRMRVQAHALHAAATLPFDGVEAPLHQTVRRLLGESAPAAALPVAQRVARAAEALEGLFAAAQAGLPLPSTAVRDGAGAVQEAMRQADIRAWLDVVWGYDDATHQHCLLVAGLAGAFALRLGFGAADCHRLVRAALLHDIGKARLPLALLNKPGRLDRRERALVETHPALGHDLLRAQGVADPELLAVVRHHHEYLDGSGYPDGLHAARIPDLVRLVTICDIYAALIEHRPYKPPMPAAQATAVLAAMAGRLDPDLLRCFQGITADCEAARDAA